MNLFCIESVWTGIQMFQFVFLLPEVLVMIKKEAFNSSPTDLWFHFGSVLNV